MARFYAPEQSNCTNIAEIWIQIVCAVHLKKKHWFLLKELINQTTKIIKTVSTLYDSVKQWLLLDDFVGYVSSTNMPDNCSIDFSIIK